MNTASLGREEDQRVPVDMSITRTDDGPTVSVRDVWSLSEARWRMTRNSFMAVYLQAHHTKAAALARHFQQVHRLMQQRSDRRGLQCKSAWWYPRLRSQLALPLSLLLPTHSLLSLC